MAEPDGDPTPPPNRTHLALLVVLAVVLVAAGAGIGLLVGRHSAMSQTDRDTKAAERASEAEDAARDRRDQLDAHIKLINPAVKRLKPVATKAPLLATSSTADRKLGDEFSVDGGDYQVHGVQVVDSFDSVDARRPAKQVDGYRYVLVDMDYTNHAKDEQAPACGTLQTVHLVLTDRTFVSEIRDKPPVHHLTYDTCGNNLPVGKGGRWVAPVLVPEHTKLAGILIEDVYARTSKSEYNVIAGKGAWMKFPKTIDVGEQGDDEIKHTYGKDRS